MENAHHAGPGFPAFGHKPPLTNLEGGEVNFGRPLPLYIYFVSGLAAVAACAGVPW